LLYSRNCKDLDLSLLHIVEKNIRGYKAWGWEFGAMEADSYSQQINGSSEVAGGMSLVLDVM